MWCHSGGPDNFIEPASTPRVVIRNISVHCPHYSANRCRSCSLLEQPYAGQLAAKEARCRALLADWADVEWLAPVASSEAGFCNKAKMVVSGTFEAPVLGIVDEQGQGVSLADCPLYPPALQASFAPLAAFIRRARIEPYDIAARRGELKYVLVTLAEHSGELMARFVLRSQEALGRIRKYLPELQAALPGLRVVSVNLQPEHKAVLEGEREILLTEQDSLTMRLNGIPLHLRPKSFFQTNTAVAEALYRQGREWVAECDPAGVWDLFCGVGGFALHVADGRRAVTGIEISAEAVASAEQSRAELGLERVSFRALDAADFTAGKAQVPELVIVNPPRRGIGAALCRFLDQSAARWVIYSSCNAETLARDLAQMPGLRLRRARLLDMFPHTAHYEVITLLEREARS
jgi:23S rRNA (uracil747-C5)-methyltransferase